MSNDIDLEILWHKLHIAHQINQTNAAYAHALDNRDFDAWPSFFMADGRYRVQARENFDRGLPLCLMDLEGQGMMKDRVYGVTQTIFHAPYYTRHVLGVAIVTGQSDGLIKTETAFSVFRAKPASTAEVYFVGRYLDEWVSVEDQLKLKSRLCVYDNEMVLNSLIYPI